LTGRAGLGTVQPVTGLREEQRGASRWLILDRPAQRNALSAELLSGLRAGLGRADGDAAVRAVCITGAGDRAFCSGMDLASAGAALQETGIVAVPQQYAALLLEMAKLGKPIVACVNGAVMAGGLGLLAACDLAIAASDASFGAPEVDVGLFPYMAMAPLQRVIGRRAALEMVFTARRLDAQEALRIGLLNRVVPRADLESAAQGLLDTLAEKSPTALRMGRRAFHATQDLPYDKQLEALCAQLVENFQAEDAAEGIAAFLEKRKPEFKGR
jgi:enoyl-CoA hydratase/carnithine racemase